MRQNIYDDEAFFQGYADLRAHPGNLNNLMEQSALRVLLPPLARCLNCLIGKSAKLPSVTLDVTL